MSTSFHKFLSIALCLSALTACDHPVPPANTAHAAAVDTMLMRFKENPTESNRDKVDEALSSLDLEITAIQVEEAKLGGAQKSAAADKRVALQKKRTSVSTDFNSAKLKASMNNAGQAVKDAAQSVTETLNKE